MMKNAQRKRPERIHVFPAAGLKVRMRLEEGGQLMPDTGAMVHHDKYWQRRLSEGTVTREKKHQEPAAPKPAKRARAAGEGASES